jgi:hypothetical protein
MSTGGIAGYPPSPYVLNLLELQNTITSAGGTTSLTTLSNAVSNLQQMVSYDTKTIYTNALSNYTTTPIQVLADMNMSNANFYINSNAVSATGSNGSTPAYVSTLSMGGITQSYISTTGLFTVGTGFFTGAVTAPSFNTPSDKRLKIKIETLQNADKTIGNLRGVRYQWRSSGQSDIGFIAQEVANWIPEAVTSNENEIYVAYDKVIPFLVESVKGLLQRVEVLEEKLREVSR